jgi:hypothetical protein
MTASLAGLKEEIFNLEEQLKMQTSEEASRRVSESDVESLINTLISRLSREQIKAITSPNNQDSEIGKPWLKPKGKVKITLSVGKKDLLDPKTKEPVDFIEENLRLELAKDWLKIRPTGGRVFLDEDGNVSTVIDEDLIFLGKIGTEPSRSN